MKYDLIIIGCGPAGLTLAQCLKNTYKKILILEKETTIGGNHKVERVENNMFTEHAPRVYLDNYKSFIHLLKEMNINFYDIFTPYNFTFYDILFQNFKLLQIHEILKLSLNFVLLTFNNDYGKDIKLKTFLNNNNFSEKSITVLDRLCRLSDGGDIDKFSLNEFFQLLNQTFLYNIYEPKLPNDEGLFKYWNEYLIKNGIEIKLNSSVKKIKFNNTFIILDDKNNEIECDKVIIAIPPVHLTEILQNCDDNIKNSFGDFNKLKQFAIDTKYITYVSITFHWDKKLNLQKNYGFPISNWGLISIKMSDYMKLLETESKTMISTSLSILDKKGNFNNKTVNECTKDELLIEAFKQLKLTYPDIIDEPTKIILYPSNYYDDKEKVWKNDESAFISTFNTEFIEFESKTVENIYNVGTHNGQSNIKYTCMESAIENAIALSHKLDPLLKDKYPLYNPYEITNIIRFTIIFIILFIIMKKLI